MAAEISMSADGRYVLVSHTGVPLVDDMINAWIKSLPLYDQCDRTLGSAIVQLVRASRETMAEVKAIGARPSPVTAPMMIIPNANPVTVCTYVARATISKKGSSSSAAIMLLPFGERDCVDLIRGREASKQAGRSVYPPFKLLRWLRELVAE
ncbi:MAG: hypothetical protein V7629_14160 [Motiliproteus sp.]